MRTAEMRRAITAAIQQERQTHSIAGVLRAGANAQGLAVSNADVEQTALFLQQYIEHVPAIIEGTEAAAREAGLLAEATALLRPAEYYWFEPYDVFPDHQGLVGLLDDAYVCLSVIQAMSNNFRARTGRPLISLDLSSANAVVRHLIGEPFASQLDAVVAQAMGGDVIRQVFETLSRIGASIPTFNTPDPIWGNASVDEIVNTRLGAMGVF